MPSSRPSVCPSGQGHGRSSPNSPAPLQHPALGRAPKKTTPKPHQTLRRAAPPTFWGKKKSDEGRNQTSSLAGVGKGKRRSDGTGPDLLRCPVPFPPSPRGPGGAHLPSRRAAPPSPPAENTKRGAGNGTRRDPAGQHATS